VADLYSTKKMGCAYICAIGEDFERDKGFVQRVRCFRPPEDHPIFGLLDSLMEKAEKGELSEDDLIDLDYYLHMSAEKVGVPYEVVVDMPLTAFSRYESPSPHIELWRKLRELKKQGIEVVEDLRELKKQLGIIANHEEEE